MYVCMYIFTHIHTNIPRNLHIHVHKFASPFIYKWLAMYIIWIWELCSFFTYWIMLFTGLNSSIMSLPGISSLCKSLWRVWHNSYIQPKEKCELNARKFSQRALVHTLQKQWGRQKTYYFSWLSWHAQSKKPCAK